MFGSVAAPMLMKFGTYIACIVDKDTYKYPDTEKLSFSSHEHFQLWESNPLRPLTQKARSLHTASVSRQDWREHNERVARLKWQLMTYVARRTGRRYSLKVLKRKSPAPYWKIPHRLAKRHQACSRETLKRWYRAMECEKRYLVHHLQKFYFHGRLSVKIMSRGWARLLDSFFVFAMSPS
ncbi:jg14550 [Pararge aegeria aegeria]|uniref:Jg14550 protein n=1 Tax=Pararge aegeria aegeria TaxID=348720 RepID=A0A8S4RCQ1_9NEOP|nr:jg14550 [Pararge aegeria aegeria]